MTYRKPQKKPTKASSKGPKASSKALDARSAPRAQGVPATIGDIISTAKRLRAPIQRTIADGLAMNCAAAHAFSGLLTQWAQTQDPTKMTDEQLKFAAATLQVVNHGIATIAPQAHVDGAMAPDPGIQMLDSRPNAFAVGISAIEARNRTKQ